MKFYLILIWKGTFICTIVAATVMAAVSDKKIIEAVKAMEREFGLKITGGFDLADSVRTSPQSSDTYFSPIKIAPDGTAIAWWLQAPFKYEETIPILTVKSLKEGTQQIRMNRLLVADSFGISSDAEVIVVKAGLRPLQNNSRWQLLAINRRSGVIEHDLTPFITQFDLSSSVSSGNNLEDISLSGSGSLVALGTPERIQVLEIASGKTLFTSSGRFPRLSPDGKRLAFVNEEKLWIHTFADGSTVQLPIKRIKGIGGWSPDGRFLLAGAWTRPMFLAWEKRQIIVDTTTSEYGVIDKLSEGNYGNNFAWVSTKLLEK